MQVVPARALVFVLTLLVSGVTFALGILLPGRAEANDLQLSVVTMQGEEGVVELQISWHWRSPASNRGWRMREELLAVSFDTRRLVFESEEAALGVGATGELLRRLEAMAGPDGTRRLFVIPAGEDGSVKVRFRSVFPGTSPEGAQFRIHVVSESAATHGLLEQVLIHSL